LSRFIGWQRLKNAFSNAEKWLCEIKTLNNATYYIACIIALLRVGKAAKKTAAKAILCVFTISALNNAVLGHMISDFGK
jgi:hypothetical protein